MSDWKVTGSSKSDSMPDAIMEIVTLGACSRATEYEITNKQTGEVKHSVAENLTQLSENIAKGRMH